MYVVGSSYTHIINLYLILNYMYLYMYLYMYVLVHVHVHVQVHICCTYMYLYIYHFLLTACTCTYLYIYMYMYLYITFLLIACTCTYVCLYIVCSEKELGFFINYIPYIPQGAERKNKDETKTVERRLQKFVRSQQGVSLDTEIGPSAVFHPPCKETILTPTSTFGAKPSLFNPKPVSTCTYMDISYNVHIHTYIVFPQDRY